MTNFAPTNATKVLAVTAVLAAILFTVGQAEAGTQWPHWKKQQLTNTPAAALAAAPTAVAANTPIAQIAVVDEVIPPVKPEDNGDQGFGQGDGWPSDSGSGNGGTPTAVPTPSAVLGGIAMLGLIAGRRRRNQDSQDA